MSSTGHPDPDARHPLEIGIVGDQMGQLVLFHDGQNTCTEPVEVIESPVNKP